MATRALRRVCTRRIQLGRKEPLAASQRRYLSAVSENSTVDGSSTGGVKPCHEISVVAGTASSEDENQHLESSIKGQVQSFFDRQEPLVLRHLLEASSKNRLALTNFADWDYWESIIIDRDTDSTTDCQVELGGNYSQSTIADIPFEQYIAYLRFFEERFGKKQQQQGDNDNTATSKPRPSKDDLIYMAQNDVFPEVLDLIEIPSFCSTLGVGSLYSTMIWIGPHGCVSPLHYDPLDNVLMQFVGVKRVFLCPPTSSAAVQAGSLGNQNNTSPLDPQQVLADGNPQGIEFQQAMLYPGDALYIPKKWFHHVRTLETSVSINTWFR